MNRALLAILPLGFAVVLQLVEVLLAGALTYAGP